MKVLEPQQGKCHQHPWCFQEPSNEEEDAALALRQWCILCVRMETTFDDPVMPSVHVHVPHAKLRK